MESPGRSHIPSFLTEGEEESIRVPEVLVVPDDYVPEVLPPTGEKFPIIVHKEHAYEVLDVLLAAYLNKESPYDQDRVRLPHDPRHMPRTLDLETMPREAAMFFFNVCYYMRGGIKSNDAVKRMGRVFDQFPDLFDCSKAKDYPPEFIVGVLARHGLGFQNTVAQQWIENARRMHERYDGDPRNIFHGVQTYEHSQELIQNDGKGNGFLGFQEKMTSMIIYYLADEGLIDSFNFPIPVDLHVMRVSIANEMLSFGDTPFGTNLYNKELTAALRGLYMDYVSDRGIDPLRLCDAVWLLSESSCGKHPGNTTIEPLKRKVRNGRSTYLVPKEVNPHDPAQQKAYAESCAICPIETTCQFNIPGTQYYVGGNIIIRGRRMRIPLPAPRPGTEIEPLFE